jgi:predicted RNA binding protein YcfA (HicA-like mRNA interferase family)
MPSEGLADIKQKDWIRACKKLGLQVETRHGKGSHALICYPTTGAKYTLQHDLHKIINIKIFRKLEEWGFTREHIFESLR